MTTWEVLFGFRGRMSRLAYFRYFVVAGIVTMLATLATYFMLLAFVPLGIAAVAVTAVATLWMNVALIVKRLHDVGFSGAHAAWIIAIGVAAMASAKIPGPAPILGGVAAWVSQLWLLFARGQDSDNVYGPAPA